MKEPLYQKLKLITSADKDGRFWEIVPESIEKPEPLRETDLEQLAEWIGRELGWIKR